MVHLLHFCPFHHAMLWKQKKNNYSMENAPFISSYSYMPRVKFPSNFSSSSAAAAENELWDSRVCACVLY